MESGEGGGCRLPEELVVEILRRLPYRSLCRSRCVCRSWRDLSYHPDHRDRLPHDLAGLLYTNYAPSHIHGDFAIRFAPAGSSPSPGLGFLPCGARAQPLDCCNGLLLCRGGANGGCHYVCNPVTGRFTTLPEPASGFQALALAAFEPHGASPRFHVLNFARTVPVQKVFFDADFEESEDDTLSDTDGEAYDGGELCDFCEESSNFLVQGLEVFLSETGMWVQRHVCRESQVRLVEGMGSVFINGFVNLLTHERKVLAVDPEGRACRLISCPLSNRFGLLGCLGQSQGFLQYAVREDCTCTMMQIWALKDFEKGEWILKHRFKIEVAPQTKILFDYASNALCSEIFYVVVFHPERDLVFLPVEGYKMLSYNLIGTEVKEICKLEPETRPRFLVYVPSNVDFANCVILPWISHQSNFGTEKWTTVPPVPEPTQAGKICVSSILCFDPAVSPHFHVVRLLEADEDYGFTEEILFEGFEIYSSETGRWVFHPHNSGWSPQSHRSRRTYFNGLLHFITRDERAVAALDMKGQTRSTIPVPRSRDVELIRHSQGRLFYANRDDRNTHKLSIYVLEGHGRWTLKHCVNTLGMFADAEYLQSGLLVGVAGIHPYCNSIFLFDSLQGRLMFYNMDSRSARVICSVCETCLWSCTVCSTLLGDLGTGKQQLDAITFGCSEISTSLICRSI